MFNKAIIGVDLDGANIRVGKVYNNQIEKHFTLSISSKKTQEYILQEIIQAIDKVFEPDIAGIGIGVPSLVDVGRGIVYNVKNIPSWKEVHLKKILEKRFNVSTYVNNDANCFAVGEKYFGKGHNYKNITALIIGTGMGAGIIIDDKLNSGVNCGAGEFGKISYRDQSYEQYCSEQFFINRHGVDSKILFERARQGDKAALDSFEQFGNNLGDAIKTILNAVDPEIIILSGSVAKTYSLFKEAMHQRLKTFPYKHTIERLDIEVSEQPQIAILGAAALYFDAQKAVELETVKIQRRQAEDALIQEQNLLCVLMDNIPDNIYFKDTKCRFTKINKAMVNWFGFKETSQMIGKSDFDFFTDEHAQPAYEDEQKIIKTGQPLIGLEEKETWADGRETWVSTTKVALKDAEGHISGIIGISRDITDRKHAETKLYEYRKNLEIAKKEADNILQNVEEGFFLLNRQVEIKSQYSKSLETILYEKNLANKNFIKILKQNVSPKTFIVAKEYIELMFKDNIDEEVINELNPLIEIEFNPQSADGIWTPLKHLSFKFNRISDKNGKTIELIATVNDITDHVVMSQQLEKSEAHTKKQMEWLLSILHVEPELLKEFMEGGQKELNYIDELLKQSEKDSDYSICLENIYRSMHLIKGNASLLDLKYFVKKAHGFEEEVYKIKNKANIGGSDFVPLVIQLGEVRNNLDELNDLIDRIVKIRTHFRPKRSYESKLFIDSIQNLINNLAQDLGKDIKFLHNEFDAGQIPYQYRLLTKEIFVQLVRNAVFHGIESADERIKLNKKPYGLIEITSFADNSAFGFKFRDDGRGLQIGKLRQKAKESGKWSDAEIDQWSDEQAADVIFNHGISTSEKAGFVAGRGVGMDIINHKLTQHNGKINVSFNEGKYCEFIISLPLEDKNL